MDKLEKTWEERSQRYGRSLEGVLTKSFPRVVNLYLHQWMFEQAAKVIDKNKKVKILDLGCGYGRLSREILQKFPRAQTTGLDISENFVRLYNEDLEPRGRAIKGDIRRLPFKKQSFDVVMVVTTLLYLKIKSDQEKCLREIFRVLRPRGYFVIIERNALGYAFITFGGLVGKLRGRENREITTFTFSDQYLLSLIKKNKGNIIQMEGIPLCTFMLPFLIIIGFVSEDITKLILKFIKIVDQKLANFIKPSVYVSYIGNV